MTPKGSHAFNNKFNDLYDKNIIIKKCPKIGPFKH